MKLKHLLKLAVVATVLIASSNVGWGQGLETFENHPLSGTSYVNGSFVGNNGITWYYVHCTGEQSFPIENKGILLRKSEVPSSVSSSTITGGIGNFSVQMRKAFTSTGDRQVELFINGESKGVSQTFGAASGADETIHTFVVNNINIAGDFVIEIRHITGNTSNRQLVIDNLSWSGYSSGGNQDPEISNIVQTPSKNVQYNQPVSVSADVTDSDGTVENVELRWGKTAENLNNTISMTSSGGNSYTTVSNIPAQYNGATIYYAVYAEDNEGGSALSSTQSYFVSPVVYLETFDVDLGDCSSYSVSGDTKFWLQSGGTALMNGYQSPEPGIEEDWLFLPVQNLDAEDLLLSFDSYKNHGTTDENNYLKLYYSANYPGQGDPTQFTWTELAFTQPEANLVWTPSGTIDLSSISGENVYIGFKYLYSTAYVLWNIDNIKLERKTYTVTFNVVDGTTPTGTDPINTATVDFYGMEKLTNVSGQTAYSWVEVGENIPFTVTKTGFHNFNGTLNVVNKNITQQVRMLSNKVAVNVSANPDANTAVISWDGSGAESYGIHYYVPNTQNEFYVSASGSGKTILVSPSTTYSVRVRSLVNGVWSGYSPAVSFTTLAGTPVIASNVNVTNLTSSSAQVNWTGSGADSYGIYYYGITSSESFYISVNNSPATIAVSPETTYAVRVRTNVGGQWSPYTQPIEFTTTAGINMLASGVNVDNITSASARINWTGEGAEAYAIYYFDLNSSAEYYTITSSSPTTIAVMPLTNYGVRVRSRINGQWSSYTQTVTFSTPAGAQMIAANVFVNNITDYTAQVNWEGSGAERYAVYYYEVGGPSQYYIGTNGSPLVINVEPGKNYAVRVRTRVNGQWTGYTAPVAFSTPITPKTAPAGIANNGTEHSVIENILVYPNPARDYANIRFAVNEEADVTVRVYTMSGVLVQNKTLLNSFGEVEEKINFEGFSSGIYIIQIVTPNHSESRRLIVQ